MSERRVIPLAVAPPSLTTRPPTQAQSSAPRITADGRTDERPQLTAPPPLTLYVHYPWCVRKCPYCDFNSHTQRSDVEHAELERRYIDALSADIELALPQVWGRRIQSVFIGGGTPSLMSASALDGLLTTIRTLLPLDPLAEITLEANPGTFESAKFRDYRAAGVNRLSIGIQSFDDDHLRQLGRIHDSREALAAIDIALTHFERVNLDLMYGLPHQSLPQALTDLDRALASGASHLSAYHLTLEPNTPFHHSPPPLPDADTAADMQDAIEARLAEAGFDHYETSAFAKPGQRCLHNLNYWLFGDYLGIGAGAHGKLSSHTGIVREMRHKHPGRYLEAAAKPDPDRDFVQERREISAADLPFEFMMNALRLNDGVAAGLFPARTGLPLDLIRPQLERARKSGLIEAGSAQLRPTLRGRRYLNDLLTLFLQDD